MTFPDIALVISFASLVGMLAFVSYDMLRRPLIK
jgi:hypothetical protein